MAAASAFALSRGEFSLARALWLCFAGKTKERLPQNPAELCFAWSAAFRRRNSVFDCGFGFDPDEGLLPENAFSWLLFARHLDPARCTNATGSFDSLLAGIPSLLSLAVGYLAEHSLAVPDDWRVQQQYGLACLKACLVDAALSEICEARDKARSVGKEGLFRTLLNGWRPGVRDWDSVLDSFAGV
jgi:hypothetical protein